MADLKINVIAVDKASPSINKVAQAMGNIAQQAGVLSGSMGRLATQLGGLIGAGGMAGLSVAAIALISNLEEVKHQFADWATGMGKAGEGLDELDQKTKRYIETLKGLQKQLELVGLAGLARTAAEFGQAQREVVALREQLDKRTQDIARLEALRAEQAKGFAIPGIGMITPGLKATEESLKKAKEDAAGLAQQLGAAQAQLSIVAKTLTHEQAEEGKKRLEEQNKLLEKQRQILERIDQELEKRFGGNKPVIAPEVPMPILGPSLFARGEMTELMFKEAENIEELNQQALRTGIKRIETEFDFYNDQAKKSFDKVDRMNERRTEEQRRQWEHMLDSIREGAGRIFDAMLTKGESVFSSLARFAEGVLQTMLRNVFQNAVQVLALSSGLGGLFGGGGRGGGGAGALAGGAASSGLGAIFGGLLGGGGAAAGATAGYATSGGITYAAGAGSAAAGGGGNLGGLFGGGAAGAATMGGTLAAGAATAGIAVAAVLATSYISGLFKAGENRRLQEQARRAGVIQGQQFAAPETQTRFGIAGGAGYAVETSLTGDIRGIGRVPTVVVNVENSMIDARHAREAGAVIGQEVSRQILQGGSYLADNIAWAAS